MSNNNFSTAMGAVGQFVAAHPELDPAKLEYSIQTLLRYLKGKKLPVTLENLEAGWKQLVEAVSAMRPEEQPAATVTVDPEIESHRKWLESMSADQLKELLKDETVAKAANEIWARPRPKPKAVPKAAPKAPAKIVLSAAEIAVNKMTADQYKKAMSGTDPKGRALIDEALAAEAKRAR